MKKVFCLLFVLVCFLGFQLNVAASSGKISISSSSTVVVGNTVTVTVTLSSSTALGAWEFDVNYDSSYLRLTSSTAENNGTYFVNYGNGSMKSKTYTLKFKALKSGSTNITVGSYDVYDWNESAMSITKSNKKITLMTQAQLEASYSKDNNLKGLKVFVGEEEYSLDEEFNKDTLEYHVTVPTGTTLVSVEAAKNDSSASVDGDGEIEVTEGLNTIPIVVTAENGSEKTYTLVINVEDQNPIVVEVDNNKYTVIKTDSLLTAPPNFSKTTVSISGFDIPAFVNEAIDYTLVGLKDENGEVKYYRYLDGEYSYYNEISTKSFILIPTPFTEDLDYVKASVEINGNVVDAYRYSEDTSVVIINAINLEDGKTNYYLYDSSTNSAIPFDDSYIVEMKHTLENYTFVILAFGAFIVVMLLVIIILIHSSRKKQKKINHFIEKQEAKIEATRKLNDVVAEVKKIEEETKKENESDSEEVFIKKSRKELKKEKKEAKNKEKEEVQEKKSDNKILDELSKIDDDTEVYDLFEDERKKKKK